MLQNGLKPFFSKIMGKQKWSNFVKKYGNKKSENEAFSKLSIYMSILGLWFEKPKLIQIEQF
jgi:hypothetical protein